MLVAIIFFLFLFYLNFERDCKKNVECFNKAAQVCKPARVELEKEGNILLYKILGHKEKCEVSIQVLKMSEDTEEDVEKAFTGKEMICKFDVGQLREEDVTEIKDVLEYCSGPLKESMYEIMIQKLYNVVAQNMGGIISEIQGSLPSV